MPARRYGIAWIWPSMRSGGVPASVLAGGASQHARNRQRSDLGGDRLRRGRDLDDPGGVGWRDASDPASLGHRRTVRHVGFSLPGRIDLGLGRAPGTDSVTTRALRRNPLILWTRFRRTSWSCNPIFARQRQAKRVRAVPGAGLDVPIWLLGSSLYSAQLAAAFGLPFAFASHFAPDYMQQAVETYRRSFKPSAQRLQPHVMLGLNVFAAETDEAARRLFTSVQQQFIQLRRGAPGPLQPPLDKINEKFSPEEIRSTDHALSCSLIRLAPNYSQRVRPSLLVARVRMKSCSRPKSMITGPGFDRLKSLRRWPVPQKLTVPG